MGTDYHILLILTDGTVRDMQDIVEQVIDSDGEPIGIIIVGIGEGEFGVMEKLDEDDGPAISCGRRGVKQLRLERGNVQFVVYRDFKESGSRLAREVVHELPGQIVEYCEARNIVPQEMNLAPPAINPAVNLQPGAQLQQHDPASRMQPQMYPSTGMQPVKQSDPYAPTAQKIGG